MSVPIVVICKDRVQYLDLELKSISVTVPKTTNVYLSNDGTQDTTMLKYLKTNEKIHSDIWNLPTNNDDWNSLIGNLPQTEIRGIADKLRVFFYAESAGTKNLGLSVKKLFEQGYEYVIKTEDDIVFVTGWYERLIEAIRGSGCDLVSGFRYFYGTTRENPKIKTRVINNLVEEVYEGFTGGQIMIVSRKYYKKCPFVFNNEIKTIWNNDDLWINECRNNGMKFGVTRESCGQHIGFKSESKQRDFSIDGKLLKVDRNVKKVSIGDRVCCFVRSLHGRSKDYLMPIYTKLITNLVSNSSVHKVACLGAPGPYFVSDLAKKICGINCDFYDLGLGNWNINSAWHLPNKYDFIFCTRCAFFSRNPLDFIKKCHQNLNHKGLLLVDWNFGHKFDGYRIGCVKDGLHEHDEHAPDNFIWSGVWNDNFKDHPQFKLFEKRTKKYGYTDVPKAIKKETPSLLNTDDISRYFEVETELLSLWEDDPLLYIFISAKKKSLQLI